jgi:hypothetical protein
VPKIRKIKKVTTSQDDAFPEGIEKHLVGCKKHEKVTGSQDDDSVGVLKKNIPKVGADGTASWATVSRLFWTRP